MQELGLVKSSLEEVHFSSVQSLSHVRLFATPWIAARQASLSITNSQGSPKLMSVKLWCHPAISSSVVPFYFCSQSLRASVFSNESTLHMRGPKYWSFSFSISPSKEHPRLISFRMDWLDLQSHISWPTCSAYNRTWIFLPLSNGVYVPSPLKLGRLLWLVRLIE